MGKEISLIAFLDEVVSRNTQHYKSDFELDAQKLRDALDSPNQDERVFYFMSRPNGTWCVLERDAFLRESDGYKIWTHYANMPAGIEAYRIVITGQCGTAPMGYVVKLNYREQVQRVIKAALPIENVELSFYSGEKVRIPLEQYPDNEAFAAIAAEVAHSRFHAKGANRSYDRGECDLDAQSISYILCRRYGIERPMPDMTNLAGLYEGWEPQERRQALDTIQDTSKQFGRSIEKNLEMGKQRSRAPVHRPTR